MILWLWRSQDTIHVIFILIIKPISDPWCPARQHLHLVYLSYTNIMQIVTHMHIYVLFQIPLSLHACDLCYTNVHRRTLIVTWRLQRTWTAPPKFITSWQNAASKKHFHRKFQHGPDKLLRLWLIKPTTRPFCLLTHKLSPLSPRLPATYDPCSIKPLHSSPPIKSIIIPWVGSRQITAVDGQVGLGQRGHLDRQNETADR